jgi:hypothetical protein
MRIRTVKPEWLDDELLCECTSDARVLSIALLLLADDEGRGRAGIAHLAGRVFAYSEDHRAVAERALRELEAARYVIIYEVDGQRYYQIRNWAKHQKVDKPRLSQLPEYTGVANPRESVANPRESVANPRDDVANVLASRARAPGSDATDQDLDHDHYPTTTTTTRESAPTETGPRPVVVVVDPRSGEPVRRAQVPKPKVNPLTEDDVASLKIGDPAITDEFIEAEVRDWLLEPPDVTDLRFSDKWRVHAVKLVRGRWRDQARRAATQPKHQGGQRYGPSANDTDGPLSKAEVRARIDERMRRARADMEARSGTRPVEAKTS